MENNVNGEVFLELTEKDLTEVAPLLADRIALRRLQRIGINEATGSLVSSLAICNKGYVLLLLLL